MSGQRTLSDMIDEVTRYAQAGAGARELIRQSATRNYQMLADAYPWKALQATEEVGLRVADGTDSTFEANEFYFPLPFGARKIKEVIIHTPSYCELEEMTPKQLYAEMQSYKDTTGVPSRYAVIGTTAQFRALSAAGTLTLKSDSGANDGGPRVRVRYRKADAHIGTYTWENDVSGAFSTGVNLSESAAAGWPIAEIYLPIAWQGNLTVEDGSGTVIAELDGTGIAPGNSSSQRWRSWSRPLARCWPTPTQDMKAMCVWQRTPVDLVDDLDVPEIPVSAALVHLMISDVFRVDARDSAADRQEAKGLRMAEQVFFGQASPAAGIVPRRGNVLSNTGVTGWRRGRHA